MASALPSLNRERLSTLAAIVLLAYSLLRLIDLPTLRVQANLLGLLLRLDLNAPLVLLTLTAALVVAGTDWLIRGHPRCNPAALQIEHWVLPGLAALGLGVILVRVASPLGVAIGLPLVDLFLVAVVASEFVVVDRLDPRYDLAALLLRALAYLLLTGVLFAITATDLRAFFAVPLILLVTSGIVWRLSNMHEEASTARLDAVLIGLLISQFAWALHYLPILPLRESLTLVLLTYLAEGLVRTYRRGELTSRRAGEYALLGMFCFGVLTVLT
jgi:hypothetical protein